MSINLDDFSPNPAILARPRFRDWGSKESVKEKHGVESVYRMSFNESPLGPSPAVVKAIQDAAANIGDYPDFSDQKLREALAAHFGRGVHPDQFFTGCSGFETLELVSRAFIRPGDECLISHPTFGIYNRLIEYQHGAVVDVPLKEGFVLDVDGLLAAVTDKTRLLILCNPNNPTGTLTPAAEITRLLDGLPENVLVIYDEVYYHYVTDEQLPDSLGYILEERPLIAIHTFSKAYGMAGLRLGYGMAPKPIADYVAKMHRGFHQNGLALAAGLAAVADQAHVQKNVAVSLEGKNWLYEQLDRLDLTYIPSQTNFVVIETPLPADEVCQKLETVGVMIRPLAPLSPRHLRVTVSTPAGNQVFVDGLQAVLEGKL